MKNFISLFIAAVIVGFACFAIAYWLFSVNKQEALGLGLSATISGFLVEYFKPAILHFFRKR